MSDFVACQRTADGVYFVRVDAFDEGRVTQWRVVIGPEPDAREHFSQLPRDVAIGLARQILMWERGE